MIRLLSRGIIKRGSWIIPWIVRIFYSFIKCFGNIGFWDENREKNENQEHPCDDPHLRSPLLTYTLHFNTRFYRMLFFH